MRRFQVVKVVFYSRLANVYVLRSREKCGKQEMREVEMTTHNYWIIGIIGFMLFAAHTDASDGPSIEEYVTAQSATPSEVLGLLADTENIGILYDVLCHPNCPLEVLIKNFTRFEGNTTGVLVLIAEHPRTTAESVELLVRLACSVDVEARAVVGRNAKTPEKILRTLSQDSNERVRSAVAGNPNIPLEILIPLAQDTHLRVRQAAVANPQLPFHMLQKFIEDHQVRSHVARNPNLSRECFVKLSKDTDEYIRGSVASNPNTPDDILLKLSKDPDEYVRLSITRRSDIPADILLILVDDVTSIREKVAANPNITPIVLQKLLDALAVEDVEANCEVRQAIANNPNTPPEYLARFVDDPNFAVRHYLARNSKTPPQTLAALADDKAIALLHKPVSECYDDRVNVGEALRIICVVAANPHTPSETLEKLAEEGYDIQYRVAINPNTPQKVLQKLAKEPVFMWIRERVASNPSTSAKILDGLAEDTVLQMRYQVALHANTSREALTKLSQDPNQYIRLVAQKRLAK